MTSRDQLIAFLSTLVALVVIVLGAMGIAAVSAAFSGEVVIGKMEAFGLGTVTGGLIGLMRLPSARPLEPTGTPTDPVNTKDVTP